MSAGLASRSGALLDRANRELRDYWRGCDRCGDSALHGGEPIKPDIDRRACTGGNSGLHVQANASYNFADEAVVAEKFSEF